MTAPRFQSNLSPERLEKLVNSATITNKKQISGLRKIIEEVLWDSINNKKRSDIPSELVSFTTFSIIALAQMYDGSYWPDSWSRNVNNIALAPQHHTNRLESRLCIALKKIQSINVKELFNVIRINKHQGLEAAIDYIMSPYEIPLVPVYSKHIDGTKQLVEIPLIPLDSESEEL